MEQPNDKYIKELEAFLNILHGGDNCNDIAQGSVVGAFSVLSRNTEENGVYMGSPAIKKRTHNTLFDKLVVCSLIGGDLKKYVKARYGR